MMAIVVMLPLMLMGVALMKVGLGNRGELSQEADQIRAQYLAEAGVAEAVTALRYDLTGDVGSAAEPALFDDGLVWVQATPLGDERTRLLAVGMKGSGRAALDVVVRRTQGDVFRLGFVSSESTDLATELFADSFDSDLGDYASQVPFGSDHARSNAFLGSNADITVEQHSTVYGDARPGPTGTTTLVDAVVTGSTAPNPSTLVMQPVEVPSLPAGPSLTLGSGLTALPPGNHRFTSMDLAVNGVLEIPGPSVVVIDGDFEVGSGCLVNVGGDGPVQIYVGGDLRMGTFSGIETPSLDPENAAFFLTGAGAFAEVKSHTGFYGLLYGPDAQIELDNSFEMYGAMAARHFYAQNTKIRLHFDEALLRTAEPTAWEFQTISWVPTAFPDRQLLIDRRDPFRVLGLNKQDLQPASEVWQVSGTTGP
jgi:hypothetical protein